MMNGAASKENNIRAAQCFTKRLVLGKIFSCNLNEQSRVETRSGMQATVPRDVFVSGWNSRLLELLFLNITFMEK